MIQNRLQKSGVQKPSFFFKCESFLHRLWPFVTIFLLKLLSHRVIILTDIKTTYDDLNLKCKFALNLFNIEKLIIGNEPKIGFSIKIMKKKIIQLAQTNTQAKPKKKSYLKKLGTNKRKNKFGKL